MKAIIIATLSAFLLLSVSLNVWAAVSLCEKPNLPDNAWQKLRGGVEVALVLSTGTELAGVKKFRCLEVYINNESSDNFIINSNFFDAGIQVFYVDDQKDVPLHSWESQDTSLEMSQYVAPAVIQPGQIAKIQIKLNPQELALLKSHPVKCSFPIYDSSRRRKIGTLGTTAQTLFDSSK